MRHTEVTGEAKQAELDRFWDLIEDKFDEDWRVDSNGDVLLEVDDFLLDRVLVATGIAFPDSLRGTYIIKGIYKPDLSYLRGDYQKRTYFFVQEGF